MSAYQSSKDIKTRIIQEAEDLGFSKVGFATIENVSQSDEFKRWLSLNYHGSMAWMENYQDKRLDPSLLMDNAKTMICLATNYHKDHEYDSQEPYIASYALSDDYHTTLKKRLKQLHQRLKSIIPDFESRYFTDTAPILERYWAEKAGLGWQGKNSLLITRDFGSYVFLSEMLINIEIEPDDPHQNYCGTCNNCMKECPTDAIVEPYVVDSRSCISYLTIEHRNEFSQTEASQVGNHIFGCDICQIACPWNKFAKITKDVHFTARDSLLDHRLEFWRFLSEDQFNEVFQKTSVKRTKFSGFHRNVRAVTKNIGTEHDI